MDNKMVIIPGRLHSVTMEGITTGADEVMDDALQTMQSELNQKMIRGEQKVVRISQDTTATESPQNGEQIDVVYINTSQAEVTVSIAASENVLTPDGASISIIIPAGGYGEANWMNNGGTIFVTGGTGSSGGGGTTDYGDLQHKPSINNVTLTGNKTTQDLGIVIPTNTSDLNNDSGFISQETDPTVPSWAKQSSKPTYTAQEVGALPADTSIPDELSDLSDDSTHRLVTDTEKATWNNKQDALVSGTNIKTINNESILGDGNITIQGGGGSQVQSDWEQSDNTAVDYIKNKPTIPVIPSNTAYLSSDSGEGIVPDDGIRAVTATSGATMTVNPDVVTVIDGAVGTATITLQVPQDNLAHVWDILMTTDSTVAVTFAMSNSATILAPSGFSIGASKAVEISVIGVGTKYYLRYGEFA